MVKWALGSITTNEASGGDGIPVGLFQILKDDAVKVVHSVTQYASKFGKLRLISHASKVMLKILQARLQQYMKHELPDVQASFRKGRGTRDRIANIHWIIRKAREFQKTSTSASLTMLTPLTV